MTLHQNDNGDWEDDGQDGADMPAGNYGGYTTGSNTNSFSGESAKDFQGQAASGAPTGDGTYVDTTALIQTAFDTLGMGTSLNPADLGITAQNVRDSSPPVPISNATPEKKEETLQERINRMWDGMNEFGRKNEKNPLLLAALGGVASHFKGQEARSAAATKQQYELDQMDRKAQIQKDQDAAISNSIIGLRRPNLVAASKLKRIGGAPVFNPNGTVA